MLEVMFLVFLGGIWLLAATVSDIKKTEIPNWISFSLIVFALGFRFFYGLFSSEWNFLFQGVLGLGIFFALGNLFYYGRMFAGGDAKVMISLGAVLPFSNDFSVNLELFSYFLLAFFIVSAVYGIFWSVYLSSKHFKSFRKSFVKKFSENKLLVFVSSVLGLIVFAYGLSYGFYLWVLGIFVFLLPFVFFYSRAIDESAMVKKVSPEKLMEGDWLYKDIKVKGKKINASWEGLSKDDIGILKKAKKSVWIREGIVFMPVFLISYVSILFFVF